MYNKTTNEIQMKTFLRDIARQDAFYPSKALPKLYLVFADT